MVAAATVVVDVDVDIIKTDSPLRYIMMCSGMVLLPLTTEY